MLYNPFLDNKFLIGGDIKQLIFLALVFISSQAFCSSRPGGALGVKASFYCSYGKLYQEVSMISFVKRMRSEMKRFCLSRFP